jgi:hypothetical protein
MNSEITFWISTGLIRDKLAELLHQTTHLGPKEELHTIRFGDPILDTEGRETIPVSIRKRKEVRVQKLNETET